MSRWSVISLTGVGCSVLGFPRVQLTAMSSSSIDVIRKVWINDGYVLVRPWPSDVDCIELCTEPGKHSEEWFGRMSITFGTPDGLRTLAKALNLAADEMESEVGQ